MVRYDRQRVASSTHGSRMAAVGQASMHSVQVPHWSNCGASGSSAKLVMISDRKNHEPFSGLMRQVFLPIHPSPACWAYTRSCTGPVST